MALNGFSFLIGIKLPGEYIQIECSPCNLHGKQDWQIIPRKSFVLRIENWMFRVEDDCYQERIRRKQESYDPQIHCGVIINEMGKLNMIFFEAKNFFL